PAWLPLRSSPLPALAHLPAARRPRPPVPPDSPSRSAATACARSASSSSAPLPRAALPATAAAVLPLSVPPLPLSSPSRPKVSAAPRFPSPPPPRIDIPTHSSRNRMAMLIQQTNLRIADAPPDRDRACHPVALPHFVAGHVRRYFRRTVKVQQPRLGQHLSKLRRQLHRQNHPAAGPKPQLRHSLLQIRDILQQGSQQRGHQHHPRDMLPAQFLHQQ